MRIAYRHMIILATFALYILLSGCASTQSTRDRAQAYYMNGDYSLAFEELFPLAKRSDPQAQYTIAYMYYYGQGTVKDEDVARSWMRKSAALGNPRAKYALQLMLDSGRGNEVYRPQPGTNPQSLPLRNQYSATVNSDSDINWIRQQSPQQYTLVLSTDAANTQRLKNALRKQVDPSTRTVSYRFKTNGQAYQAFAYGSYATTEAAEVSKNKLDKELRHVVKLARWQAVQDVMLP